MFSRAAAVLSTITVVACSIAALAQTSSSPHVFTGPRSAYRLNLVSGGTEVVDVQTGRRSVVPFGEQMRFAGEIKYSKNIRDSLRYVGSHLEGYGEWQRFVDVPVDFLRTGAYWSFIGAPQSWGPDQLNGRPPILPDRADKVIVAYINATEYTAIGRWDPSFDPAWDRDGDAIIDSGVAGLLSTPVEYLTVPPIENLTHRRGDEPQFVDAS